MKKHTIAIAGDHAGFDMKDALKTTLAELGYAVEDLGTHNTDSVDYPDYADAMAAWIKKHPDAKGVLVCGSGIGISIAANRHKHVRAALCWDGEVAQLARKHNDANVICLGARLIDTAIARQALTHFLQTEFEGGRHEKRVNKLSS